MDEHWLNSKGSIMKQMTLGELFEEFEGLFPGPEELQELKPEAPSLKEAAENALMYALQQRSAEDARTYWSIYKELK